MITLTFSSYEASLLLRASSNDRLGVLLLDQIFPATAAGKMFRDRYAGQKFPHKIACIKAVKDFGYENGEFLAAVPRLPGEDLRSLGLASAKAFVEKELTDFYPAPRQF